MQEITLYTTPVCGYCHAAKRLLSQKGLPYKEVDVARDPDLRQRLSRENNGYRTVPMIFIGSEFIGGYTDLAELDRTGQLDTKLNRA
jgi:glutaredoxin 3